MGKKTGIKKAAKMAHHQKAKSEKPKIQGEAEPEKSKAEIASFAVGDVVQVTTKIVEGEKIRDQVFEGLVMARKNSGVRTFTVRKIGAGGVGVERIWPLLSPSIKKIVVKTKGKVRRAKLYYLRGRKGKAALKVKTSL